MLSSTLRPPRPQWGHDSGSPAVMRDELSHALVEAQFELDLLPPDPDGAIVGLYAILDDLKAAIRRTERMDPRRTA